MLICATDWHFYFVSSGRRADLRSYLQPLGDPCVIKKRMGDCARQSACRRVSHILWEKEGDSGGGGRRRVERTWVEEFESCLKGERGNRKSQGNVWGSGAEATLDDTLQEGLESNPCCWKYNWKLIGCVKLWFGCALSKFGAPFSPCAFKVWWTVLGSTKTSA